MAKLRNYKNICLHCFGDLNDARICLSCGKKADDTPALPHHLPRRTLLLKRYLIDKAIGEGGFGITYKAWDTLSDTPVAIKEYYPSGYVTRNPRSFSVIINDKHLAHSNRGLKRFIDESKHLNSINKLNGIVSAKDFFSANGTAYIVMEFLDGISLKRYVKRKGKLDCSTVLTILKPVIYSLVEVHNVGLLHRDISPDNILITKSNEVKLIDFGASKEVKNDGKSVSIVLKQGFAPEEQYRLHGQQGPWTDIYALGVTIYYCITGKVPPESIQRMYDDTIVPPSKNGASITPKQEATLMRAIAVYAKDRYHSVSELIDDFYDNDGKVEKPLPRQKTYSSTRKNYSVRNDKSNANSNPNIKQSLNETTSNDGIPVRDAYDDSPIQNVGYDKPKDAIDVNSSYYFPPRDASVRHSRTAEEIRALIMGVQSYSAVERQSEEIDLYAPRTKKTKRKLSSDLLRNILFKNNDNNKDN